MEAKEIWQKVFEWVHIKRESKGWREEVELAIKHVSSKTAQADIYRMAFAAGVYLVWQERNNRIFKQTKYSIEAITRQCI